MNFNKLKDFMDSLTSWIIPGNTVYVYKDNECVFNYSSGYSDIENKIPMNGNEFVNLYSCSKPVTVVAAMQLFEKGKFLLSDPLYEYIPEYREMYVKTESGELVKAKNPITLWNLFTMTAGFTYNFKTEAFEKARELTNGRMDTLTVAKCIASDPLLFEPGTRWSYSLCHDVLGGFVEAVSGKKFRDYVKENIFEPLGMNDSMYHNEPVLEKMAQQYSFVSCEEDDIVKLQSNRISTENGYIENVGKKATHVIGSEYDSGGAGITATVSDYGKFANALACGGLGKTGERILSPQTIELIKTPQLSPEQKKTFSWEQFRGYNYGLGVRTLVSREEGGSNGSIGEFGWGGAAGATLLVDTELKLGVAYAHHMLNPQEGYYQPRLRNVVYSCID